MELRCQFTNYSNYGAITVTGAKTPKLTQWPYLGRPLGSRAWLEQLEAKTGGSLAPKKRGRQPGFKFA